MTAVDSVEDAVVNARLAADDLGGTEHDRFRINAICREPLMELMKRHRR